VNGVVCPCGTVKAGLAARMHAAMCSVVAAKARAIKAGIKAGKTRHEIDVDVIVAVQRALSNQ
jgi:hypothetical protein